MLIQLNNRTLLKLSGTDVQSFLQGQLSNDINSLKKHQAQLNAYCQHQGKIIALLWVMKIAKDYYLSFPDSLRSVVIQKLTLFKMMSDVNITDVSDDLFQVGIIGTNQQKSPVFQLNKKQSITLVDTIDNLDFVHQSEWDKLSINNNLPEVYLETTEKFIPQMLNLDINNLGVSFTKGCYPGQEVVSRLHYLGKSKRRMMAFVVNDTVIVGDALIVSNSKSAKASGLVVRSVKSDDKYFCLATVEVKYQAQKITLNHANGIKLTRIET